MAAAAAADGQVGALSQQQRQIVAGTFNMQRDRKTMAADKFREGMTVLTLSQSRLREQVEGLVERMNSRLVDAGSRVPEDCGTAAAGGRVG